jgi:AcrR family transcriptional regulator
MVIPMTEHVNPEAEPVGTPTARRSYRSPLRAAAAARTRAQIRDAGARLFIEKGYVTTTVRDIADAAGVAVRTVFSSFPGGKLQVFHDALNVAIAGDEEPVAIADRDEVRASLTSPDRIVDALVELGSTIQDRAGRLIMTMIESSGADEDMQRLAAEGEAANTANMRAVAEALDRFGLLRESVDVDRATDILVALCSPHVHHILRQSRGWSASDYRSWLTETINQTVVRPPA